MLKANGRCRRLSCRCVTRRFVVLPILALLAAAQAQTPAEMFVLSIHPRSLLLFDAGREQIVGEIQTRGHNPREVVPSPDGKFLYVTTEGRAHLEVVNLQSRTVDRIFDLAPRGYRLTIYGVTINQAGDRLYVHVKPVQEMADEYKVDPPQIWSVDLATGKTRTITQVPEGVAGLFLTRDQKRLVAWGRDLYTIDIAQGRITDTFPLLTRRQPDHGPLNTLAIFIQYEQSQIMSFPYYTTDPLTRKDLFGLANLDVDSGKMELIELGPAIPLYSAVVSPNRKRAYAVMNQLVVVDLEARRILQTQDLPRTSYVVNISRDGSKLYVSGAAPFIRVYDTSTMQLVKTLELPGDASIALRALPPGAMR